MLERRPILSFALCCILAGYLFFTLKATAGMARNDTFTGCRINIDDALNTGFVTEEELSKDCDNILEKISSCKRKDVSIYELEGKLRNSDKIENVNVYVLNNGVLAIDIVPMKPVARVFNGDNSYYINAGGKQISSDPRYHVDVPVVVGYFDDELTPMRLLPMLKYISVHPEIDALVSTVEQSQNGDIIIVPSIRGHVINFGDTSLVENKFSRLREFYRQVMPLRGWETYDTLSVKWRGQVVASRRDKTLRHTNLASVVEDYDDIDDTDTMTDAVDQGSSAQ